MVDQIDQNQDSYSQRFMILLQAYPLYKNFSNKAWIPDSAGTYDSLESLHDQIHGLVGTNGGHMAYVRKALRHLGFPFISRLAKQGRRMLADPSDSSNIRHLTQYSGYTMQT